MEFELEKHQWNENARKEPRLKTALRLKYEAEVRAFKTRYLSIENVRKTLGFSQRKMCQLLMVDPSAWSRWMKDESKIPPHIYRALEWLLLAEQKNPDLLRVLSAGLMSGGGSSTKGVDAEVVGALKERIHQMEAEIEALKTKNLASVSKFMTLLIGLFALALLLILVK